MSFTAVMTGSGCVCGFRVPTEHGKIGVSTSNHEPVGGIRRHESTDLTPEFLQRSHGSLPRISVVNHVHSNRTAFDGPESCRLVAKVSNATGRSDARAAIAFGRARPSHNPPNWRWREGLSGASASGSPGDEAYDILSKLSASSLHHISQNPRTGCSSLRPCGG